jgi:hypothetical protein
MAWNWSNAEETECFPTALRFCSAAPRQRRLVIMLTAFLGLTAAGAVYLVLPGVRLAAEPR